MMLQSHILTLCSGECMYTVQVTNCGQCCGMNVRKPEGGEDIPVKVDGGKAQQNKGTPQSSPQFYSNAKLVNLSQE